MVNCVIFASVTEAALTGDRFSCIEARHASFLDAYQCTVALKAPEMVLRAPHTMLVHALFLLHQNFTSATVFAQSRSLSQSTVQSVGSSTSVAPTWYRMVARGPTPRFARLET
jgi:hypothetical protein